MPDNQLLNLDKPVTCLACGYLLETATRIGDPLEQSRGRVSICVNCSDIALFTEEGGLRPPTNEEWKSIMRQDNVRQILAALRIHRGSKL